jgi:hypothetical protein
MVSEFAVFPASTVVTLNSMRPECSVPGWHSASNFQQCDATDRMNMAPNCLKIPIFWLQGHSESQAVTSETYHSPIATIYTINILHS